MVSRDSIPDHRLGFHRRQTEAGRRPKQANRRAECDVRRIVRGSDDPLRGGADCQDREKWTGMGVLPAHCRSESCGDSRVT